ncbi:MAG: biotin transporter BioY [Alphaproteobacteria bacterium]|nr:biotin transporter BioY [Alphaproteobacteria bacterium]
MTATSITSSTLSQVLWPVHQSSISISYRMIRNLILICVGSLLLAISAKIQVPMWPVPITMQTYVVLVLGAFMGRNLALATVSFYLMQGVAGLPVFAQGAGFAYVFGPTGGYLLGFAVSAYLMGWMAERGYDRKIIPSLAIMMLGHIVIFAFGMAWLLILNPNNLPFTESLGFVYERGLAVFSVATILKTLLAALTTCALWQVVRTKKSK